MKVIKEDYGSVMDVAYDAMDKSTISGSSLSTGLLQFARLVYQINKRKHLSENEIVLVNAIKEVADMLDTTPR